MLSQLWSDNGSCLDPMTLIINLTSVWRGFNVFDWSQPLSALPDVAKVFFEGGGLSRCISNYTLQEEPVSIEKSHNSHRGKCWGPETTCESCDVLIRMGMRPLGIGKSYNSHYHFFQWFQHWSRDNVSFPSSRFPSSALILLHMWITRKGRYRKPIIRWPSCSDVNFQHYNIYRARYLTQYFGT